MIQLIVTETYDSKKDTQQINTIYVSQAQKEIINAITGVLSESLFISEPLTKKLLYKSIKVILSEYECGNCYMFEQHFNSKERRILYDKIRDQFILLLGDMMTVTSEHKQIMMGLNDYFIPLIEEHYSIKPDPIQMASLILLTLILLM
ncbi:MAG: hypothetical protein ACW99F_10005 [Candidatus Hodarchaeales archaeon]|jgi:hypothetical protein